MSKRKTTKCTAFAHSHDWSHVRLTFRGENFDWQPCFSFRSTVCCKKRDPTILEAWMKEKKHNNLIFIGTIGNNKLKLYSVSSGKNYCIVLLYDVIKTFLKIFIK